MEESGANTLYLALGFLEWKETKQSDRTHRTPILLIPLSLSRKSVQSGFSINRHDEDAIVNVTLLELLKRNFELEIPGVNPPPEDESGVDVAKVFRLFQQAVKDMPGWEVHPDVWIAQFSFSKFLLWQDLNDRIAMLSQNRVVDHLVNRPGEPFIDQIDAIQPESLDSEISYQDIFCPVSADSSQLASVIAASTGKNFVMHGPPGTGKSQTITNLIAHCLAIGKRILFVAEKRAALEVVHKRLSQIGLGPFCLELHSNKTGKADVLNQLGEAIDFVSSHSTEEWNYTTSQLEASRTELNTFVQELHKLYPNGMTAYLCYSWIITHRDQINDLSKVPSLHIDGIENQSKENFHQCLTTCDNLIIRGSLRRLSIEAKKALNPFNPIAWTPDWEAQVLHLANALDDTSHSFRKTFDLVGANLGFNQFLGDHSFFESACHLSTTLLNAPTLPSDFVQIDDWSSFKSKALNWIRIGRQRDASRTLFNDFDLPGVLALSIEPLRTRFNFLQENKGLFYSIKKWFLLKPVRLLCSNPNLKFTSDQVIAFFQNAHELQITQSEINEANEIASQHFGIAWNQGEANWDLLEDFLLFGDKLHLGIADLVQYHPDLLSSLRTKISELIPVANEQLSQNHPIAQSIVLLGSQWELLLNAQSAFHSSAQTNTSVPLPENNLLDRLSGLTTRLKTHQASLQNWCRWQESYQAALQAQMEPLLHAIEQDHLQLDDLRFAFEARYRESFITRLISISQPLRDFWGDEHQKRIQIFNELDVRYTQLTQQTIISRLATQLPPARSQDCPRNSELGILQRERAKKARHKAVRKLFSEIPNILPILKPCFLMSPLSVAQYLDVDQDNFDIVVFDEASQIPVWDAIGAIARGKQLIVVGDPKQLPPTNFFERAEREDASVDDSSVQDLESILDECLGSGLDTYNLRWHYRSRQEGLIAFSNHHYYENNLYTFPSPYTKNTGVSLVNVPHGFYDKGKSRTNLAEAEAIIIEVVRRLKDPHLSQLSIGIVTFSQTQQTLILDKLDEARNEHPEIENFFGDETEEPVFVKNLENVQGDERDVIIFSICYGPDQNGKTSMNFGPLIRKGGERRLNVAVTRAKHQIIVYSTLRSEQIDLSRTRAKGAEHLKAYLEYAERGPRALAAHSTAVHLDHFASSFEKEIADFLRSHDYEVHAHVGCSGYKIDLAIVSPNNPNNYLLGIECDGSTYHTAATARDRDHLRKIVLDGLGWKIHHLWITDWWRDHTTAANDLLEVIQDALETLKTENLPGLPTVHPDHPSAATSLNTTSPQPETSIIEPVREFNPISQSIPPPSTRAIRYPDVTPQIQFNQELFYDPTQINLIREQMIRIIEWEGPIVQSLLVHRLTEEWQFTRAGSRIQNICNQCFPSHLALSQKGNDPVYWPEGTLPSSYTNFRIPNGQKHSRRSIDEIPQEELQNAALNILEQFISFPRIELQREIAKQFEISRLTQNISEQIENAINQLIAQALVQPENQIVKLSK